jgi:hypothetical protein
MPPEEPESSAKTSLEGVKSADSQRISRRNACVSAVSLLTVQEIGPAQEGSK